MIKRQRREHPLVLGRGVRSDPGVALHRIGDQIAMRQHRAFRLAGRAAGILQQRDVATPCTRVFITLARPPLAGLLQHGELLEAPRPHRVADIRIGEVESPALEHRHEIAEPRHHDVPDFGLRDDLLQLMGEILQDDDDFGAAIGELLLQFARRVERIDIDHDQSGAQRAEKRHRISEHVRQHQCHAVAGAAADLLDQKSGEVFAVALPLGIASCARRATQTPGAWRAPGTPRSASPTVTERRRDRWSWARPRDRRRTRSALLLWPQPKQLRPAT